MVAQQHQVTASVERRHGSLGRADGRAIQHASTGHRQIVAEHCAAKAELAAQDVAEPALRKTGRPGINLGVDHVRRHHRRQGGVEPAIGRRVVGQDGFEAAPVHRQVGVRVGPHKAMARKVFAAIGHTALQQAVHQAFRQQADHARVAAEGTVADHAAGAKIQVQHRGEAQINTASAQLGAQHVAAGGGRVTGAHGAAALPALAVLQPHLTQRPHRRQMGEAIRLKALHPAALVVDADQQVSAQLLDAAA